jgi:hypothetical protein
VFLVTPSTTQKLARKGETARGIHALSKVADRGRTGKPLILEERLVYSSAQRRPRFERFSGAAR